VGIATHDPVLVERALVLLRRLSVPRGSYEFQMLLGVAGGLRQRLVAEGHRLRVYVPYGHAWYASSVRPLTQDPAIARHVLEGVLRGHGGRRKGAEIESIFWKFFKPRGCQAGGN